MNNQNITSANVSKDVLGELRVEIFELDPQFRGVRKHLDEAIKRYVKYLRSKRKAKELCNS